MLKNAYFLEKYFKNRFNAEDSVLEPPIASPIAPIAFAPKPHVVIPTYYYNFVEFVSTVKMRFITFSLQPLQILWRGAQDYFLPQGAGYSSYATGLKAHPPSQGATTIRAKLKLFGHPIFKFKH